MDIIRKIVKEELQKALFEIQEPVTFAPSTPSEEEILQNFEKGRAFGINRLAIDIKGLEEYYMNEYFPRSEIEDAWMFEIETSYGGSQLIEIRHQVNNSSYWKLDISELQKGSDVPAISHSTGAIKGYNNFIDAVNTKLERFINPNFL